MKNLLTLLMMLFCFSAFSINSETMKTTSDFQPFLHSIEQLDFPTKDYSKSVHQKTQIVLHHTASGKGISGDFRTFLKPGKIATPIIVGHDYVYQLFSSKYWAYHLGIKKKVFSKHNLPYKNLNASSIAIEIDNWGPLKLVNGKYRTYINKFGEGNRQDRKGNKLIVTVPHDEVVHYANGFRGYNYYQKYTPFQIDSVKNLLEYWNLVYDIPLDYNEDMWKVSRRALSGKKGVFTHVSYRKGKSDCHPQPELISMLKSLV